MMSQQQIRSMSDDAAYRASQEGQVPLVVWKDEDLRHIPFLGRYVPQGWRQAQWADLPLQPRTERYAEGSENAYLMVDSSGFGADYEPALTFAEFAEYVNELHLRSRRVTYGFGIVEAGQFQIVASVYIRDDWAKAVEVSEPEGWCEYHQSSVECDSEAPVCDWCDEHQDTSWGVENDWCGEHGAHLSCEPPSTEHEEPEFDPWEDDEPPYDTPSLFDTAPAEYFTEGTYPW